MSVQNQCAYGGSFSHHEPPTYNVKKEPPRQHQETNSQFLCRTSPSPKQLHQSISAATESINNIPGLICHAKFMQHDLYKTAEGWIIALLLWQHLVCRKHHAVAWKNGDLWDFISKAFSVTAVEKEGGKRENWGWKTERKEEKGDSDAGRKKWGEEGEKQGEALLAAICSCALDNLGHFCHRISIRWAETPHLPFSSFPF